MPKKQKIENFLRNQNTNLVVCFRHPRGTKRNEKDRSHENVERGMAEELNAAS
ncbi:hypothetical protein ACTXT7_016374, partial [Hymenolepis weldensis]